MNARQQLAELLGNDPDDTFDQSYRYIHFIREHGPAIAALIDEASRELRYNGLDNKFELDGIDLQFGIAREAVELIRNRIRAAVRNLHAEDPE